MKLAHSIDWPEEYKRGLVVVAHADDAEYGCSGTVARLVAEGWDMAYVLCTDGSKGSSDPDITEVQLSELRREEQENAGKILYKDEKGVCYRYKSKVVKCPISGNFRLIECCLFGAP